MGPLNNTEYKLLQNYNEKPVLTRPQQVQWVMRADFWVGGVHVSKARHVQHLARQSTGRQHTPQPAPSRLCTPCADCTMCLRCSFPPLFHPSLPRSLSHSLIPSLPHSLPHSLTPPLLHSLTPPSLPHSIPPSLAPALPSGRQLPRGRPGRAQLRLPGTQGAVELQRPHLNSRVGHGLCHTGMCVRVCELVCVCADTREKAAVETGRGILRWIRCFGRERVY